MKDDFPSYGGFVNPFVKQKRDGIEAVKRLIIGLEPIELKKLKALCEINGFGEKTTRRYIKILLDAGLIENGHNIIRMKKQKRK